MIRALLAIAFAFFLWLVSTPAAIAHPIPTDCAHSRVPTTYEAPQNRAVYLAGQELAGYNMIDPDDTFFGIPRVELGPRENRLVADEPYIPPALLKAIGWVESGTAQADHSVPWRSTGPTKISFDCGHGIMQITSGMTSPLDGSWPSTQQALVATHSLFNIARGAAILVQKWNTAPEQRPVVGYGNPKIMEDWYYALWSYNGFVSVNNPLNYAWPRTGYSCGPADDGFGHNRGNYPYQDLVYGCVSRPPEVNGQQLWTPLSVTLPDQDDPAFLHPLSHFPDTDEMDMPRPRPGHGDPTSQPSQGIANFLLGSPSLSVSRTAVNNVVNQVTISNSGSAVLAWRAKSNRAWISLDRQAGVALEPRVPCAPNEPCERSPRLTITVNTALAPARGSGQVTIESLTTGQRVVVQVNRNVYDHFYTISDQQRDNAISLGYVYEREEGYVSPTSEQGLVPLYRLWNSIISNHFYTTSTWERDAATLFGYTFERVEGYVSPTSEQGLVPLYRLWNPVITDHFYTTSTRERDVAALFGYRYERVAAYVSPTTETGLVPLHRLFKRP